MNWKARVIVFLNNSLRKSCKKGNWCQKRKEARRLGKRAYLTNDTLYIDGTPVRA
ncbi:hypothetical protein DPMN_186410 [Dreissena polymorpha]|uniref:Uncharacterized protein n=1 Tax=Dreissena polymorpha TaxID=45954 RepID=A0A9D4DQD1_DREPO|nr:hypothetical protein DPMN_186410 [Dreissena polymorpha]